MSAKGKKTSWPSEADKAHRFRAEKGSSAPAAAKKDKVPETREEAEALLHRAKPSVIIEQTWIWLELEDDFSGLSRQTKHVETILNDRLLAAMLGERMLDLTSAMRKGARELASLQARHMEDVYCKYYVRRRIMEMVPDDTLAARDLRDSISRDLDLLSHGSGPKEADR